MIAVGELLIEHGPSLPFPCSAAVLASRHGQMRELRVQTGGRPSRVSCAFDPRRSATLLIGGAKTGDSGFYRRYIPLADKLYDEHLKELGEEGLIK